MNCQGCNTTVDYRFLTNCPNCETKQAGILITAPIQDPVESEKRLTWTKRFVNLAYIFVSSLAGMVSGAVVLYFGAAIICITFLPSSGNPSEDCLRGNAIAFLSIISGGFLGTLGGSVFAMKNPLCKRSC